MRIKQSNIKILGLNGSIENASKQQCKLSSPMLTVTLLLVTVVGCPDVDKFVDGRNFGIFQ